MFERVLSIESSGSKFLKNKKKNRIPLKHIGKKIYSHPSAKFFSCSIS